MDRKKIVYIAEGHADAWRVTVILVTTIVTTRSMVKNIFKIKVITRGVVRVDNHTVIVNASAVQVLLIWFCLGFRLGG